MLAYDIYQRGMSLQNQRGGHASAFFKGTHQCAHKATPFDGNAFDAFTVNFDLSEPCSPSPWGMPAFELVDYENPGAFFLDYKNFNTVATSDFTAEGTDAYINLRDIASHIRYLFHAFPSLENNAENFDTCPESLDRDTLTSFHERRYLKESHTFIWKVNSFEKDTVDR